MPLTGREKRKNNFDMEQVKLTCQVCENHCALEAEVEDGEVCLLYTSDAADEL